MIPNSDQITHNKVDIFLDDKHGGDLSDAVRVNRKIKKWIDLSTGINAVSEIAHWFDLEWNRAEQNL